MMKSFYYIKNNIINFTFLILFSLYLLLFPFYIDVKSVIEILLFVVVLFFFYINLFFLLKNISRDKNYFSMFLVWLFQFWLLVFLFINIENLFFWSWYLHAKYFYLNFLIYAFHTIVFLVSSIFLYKNILVFNNSERKVFITIITFIFVIYNILPSVKVPYVPSNFFILNEVINEYVILKQDYNSEEKKHFLNNSEYYIDKFKNNNQYKYLLKKDLYNYEFNNSID